jgi:hypothetical protein
LIARSEYEFFKERFSDEELFSKKTKFKIIESYVPLPIEISEFIDYYINLDRNHNDNNDNNDIININHTENNIILNEMDQAIIDAQKNIIDNDLITDPVDEKLDINNMIDNIHMKCKDPKQPVQPKKIKIKKSFKIINQH